ncbi:hypothetical protein F5141DRAFT_1062943 [Pisolithus sp. B1]|nr:hypothetical protein F5141DRAFT_1062943 [Pisolithus sp. B1]
MPSIKALQPIGQAGEMQTKTIIGIALGLNVIRAYLLCRIVLGIDVMVNDSALHGDKKLRHDRRAKSIGTWLPYGTSSNPVPCYASAEAVFPKPGSLKKTPLKSSGQRVER